MAIKKATESRVRRKAADKGLKLMKPVAAGWFNKGGYRLLDPRWSLPLLGKRYDVSLSKIERYLDHL